MMITSLQNSQVKDFLACADKKNRRQRQQFIIEGLRLISQGVDNSCPPSIVFYTTDFHEDRQHQSLLQQLAAAHCALYLVSDKVMAKLSDTASPPGIVGIASIPKVEANVVAAANLVLVLDAIMDPGNLGTILRTAVATGVKAVVCTAGCVDPYSPKVVRSAMGAHFSLPLAVDASWSEIAAMVDGKSCFIADAGGEQTLWQAEFGDDLVLIIGNEAHGVSAEARSLAKFSVKLPMHPGIESLNAAVAASVILFEVMRQKQQL